MAEKPTIYLETSFLSYLAARATRDLITAQRQLSSQLWWETKRHGYDLRVSQGVVAECSCGDPSAATRRLSYLSEVVVLPESAGIKAVSDALLAPQGPIPLKATADALHVATATFFGCTYLLTWNFRHIANAQIRRLMDNILREKGYEPTIICTPDELSSGLFN